MALIPQFFTASTKEVAEKALQLGHLKYPGVCFIKENSVLAWITEDDEILYTNNSISFDDLTEEQIAALKGEQGVKGEDGLSPTIDITETSTGYALTFVDVNGSQTIVLKNGKDGSDGVDGTNGTDGISPTIELSETDSGVIVTVTNKDNTQSFTLKNGKDGTDGTTLTNEQVDELVSKSVSNNTEIVTTTSLPTQLNDYLTENDIVGMSDEWLESVSLDFVNDTTYIDTSGAEATLTEGVGTCTIDVQENEVYVLSSRYYFNVPIYVITDSSGKMIAYEQASNSNVVENMEITIPSGGSKLIIQIPFRFNTLVTLHRKQNGNRATENTIGEDSISYSKLANDLKNLYIPHYTDMLSEVTEWETGYFMSTSGALTSDASYSYALIKVNSGDKYRIKGTHNYSAVAWAILTSGIAPHSLLACSTNGGSGAVAIDNTITIPDNGYYLLISNHVTYLGKCNDYQLNDNEFNFPCRIKENKLHGKKIAFNGDSICYGAGSTGGYAKIISDLTGCTIENRAIGGATLSYAENSDKHIVCTDVSNMCDDADIICFEGGINDFWASRDLGTCDTTSETRFTDEVDNTTLAGALESIFRQAIEKWVGKPICFVITHKIQNVEVDEVNGINYTAYHDMIVTVCNKYSIPYCDLWLNSGLNCKIETLKTNFTDSGDGIHPNEAGYKAYYVPQIMAMLERISPM